MIPELAYADVAEAAEWLCNAFGFMERIRIGRHRAQLVFGDGAVIVTELGKARADAAAAAHSVLVRVEDADLHHQQAASCGARIVNPPADYPYGERQYNVNNPARRLYERLDFRVVSVDHPRVRMEWP